MATRTRKTKLTRAKATKVKIASLTAPERETVILMNDEDALARISTHQRAMITKLRNNPSAKEVEDLTIGSSVGYTFEIPAKLISIRKEAKISKADRQAKKEHAKRIRPTTTAAKSRKTATKGKR